MEMRNRLVSEFINIADKYHGLKVSQLLHRNQNHLGLVGVVPVEIKDKSFNLPVKIIIDKNYPMVHPLTFANPSEQHIIKPNEYVNLEGQINLPLFSNWNGNNYNSFNLFTVIQETQTILAIANPVYQKPKDHKSVSIPRVISNKSSFINTLNNDVEEKLVLLTTYLNSEDEQLNLLNNQLKLIKCAKDQSKTDMISISSEISKFQNLKNELKQWIETNDSVTPSSLKINELIPVKDEKSSYLLAVISEKATNDDLLLALQRALNMDIINLDEYLKKVRDICLCQFNLM